MRIAKVDPLPATQRFRRSKTIGKLALREGVTAAVVGRRVWPWRETPGNKLLAKDPYRRFSVTNARYEFQYVSHKNNKNNE
jgi:hypothetical protein